MYFRCCCHRDLDQQKSAFFKIRSNAQRKSIEKMAKCLIVIGRTIGGLTVDDGIQRAVEVALMNFSGHDMLFVFQQEYLPSQLKICSMSGGIEHICC
jgi:hypothetical protein